MLRDDKRVYYSETHFVPYSKKGKLLNKVISPVDNTGFRSREGNDLFVFTTEKECIEEWNKQIDECCERIKEKERSIVMELQEERMKLNNTKL